jgi:hypothetical protein
MVAAPTLSCVRPRLLPISVRNSFGAIVLIVGCASYRLVIATPGCLCVRPMRGVGV